MTQHTATPSLGHPLELIPFFRRWPNTVRRNMIYTILWSTGLGLLFAAAETLLTHDQASWLDHLWPMLLMSNLCLACK